MQNYSATPNKWADHSLDNPAENLPCAEPLEAFVHKIGWQLQPGSERGCSREEVARMLCKEFHLKPPVLGEKIRTFLECAGIFHDVAPFSAETTFIPNRQMSRWEIYTRPCATYEWSREVWHDVWEILFWRCYHLIPWWKDWAAKMGDHRPHDKADDFAYHVLLSPNSVPGQAKKRQYDLYEIAKHYSVPLNLAFRALNSCTNFPHPLVFAVIRLNARPVAASQTSLEDLFAEDEPTPDVDYAEVYHKTRKGKYIQSPDLPMDFDQQKQWRAVECTFQLISEHLRQKKVLQIDRNDPICLYSQQPEPRQWTVSHLFGLDLPSEVSIITRQSPRCTSEIFLQIIPPEELSHFWQDPEGTASSEELLQQIVQREWRQAAHSVAKGGAKLPTASL